MSNLNEKAMLVRLTIRQWTARKLDKKVTQETNEAHGAKPDAGRYHKQLVEKQNLKEIIKIVNSARTFHYENTLPWLDEGARILTAANFLDYSTEIRNYEGRFNSAVREFLNKYQVYVEQSRISLNGMFNEADYPSPKEINRLFEFSVDILPVPDSGDFRVSLNRDEIARIQAAIEAKNMAAMEIAAKDLWDRLYASVYHIKERLYNPEGIFRDSMISNLQELCDLLPKLNINNDPNLNIMANEAKATLNVAPDLLRNNTGVRQDTAAVAAGILEKMKGYCG